MEPVPEIRQAARDGLEHAPVALRNAWAGDVDRLGGLDRSLIGCPIAIQPAFGTIARLGDVFVSLGGKYPVVIAVVEGGKQQHPVALDGLQAAEQVEVAYIGVGGRDLRDLVAALVVGVAHHSALRATLTDKLVGGVVGVGDRLCGLAGLLDLL